MRASLLITSRAGTRGAHLVTLIMCAATIAIGCSLKDELQAAHYPRNIDYEPLRMHLPLTAREPWHQLPQLDPDAGLRVEARISPVAPLFEFMLAELYRRCGDVERAHWLYSDLVDEAFHDSLGGSWVGDVVTSLSLLESARLLGSSRGHRQAEIRRLVRLAQPFVTTGTPHRALDLPVLGGVPQAEEIMLKDLGLLARHAGLDSAALSFFTEYLEASSTLELGPDDIDLMGYLASSGLTSSEELSLIRGKRLCAIRRFDEAVPWLYDAISSDKPGVRAEARYYLSRAILVQEGRTQEAIDLLNLALDETNDHGLIEKILFFRATGPARRMGRQGAAEFVGSLTELVERFPNGDLADDALYELARYYADAGDLERAFRYFSELREHPGPNDWIESAHFRPAIMLYAGGGASNMLEAEGLLRRMLAGSPMGDLSLPGKFWLARLALERNDTLAARQWFEQVIATCPYDYYAIRARMHLNIGATAAESILADPKTLFDLRRTYVLGNAEALPQGGSPSLYRLRRTLESGLYATTLAETKSLDRFLGSGLPADIEMDDLDHSGILTDLVLLQALRQDAQAVATASSDAHTRLAVASAVGNSGGDWPLAMLLIFGLDRSTATQFGLQNDPHYLNVAYPAVFSGTIRKAAKANAVSPDLLYGVMRRESLFYTAAVSKRGAMGLFQFMPSAFATLDNRWDLLDRAGLGSMEAYLSDPGLTIELGARWFGDELLPRNNGNVLLAVMEHNAGYPAVKGWTAAWARAGRGKDTEYMIETAGFVETRIFTRSVLTDMVIVKALGLFGKDAGSGRVPGGPQAEAGLRRQPRAAGAP